jgi:hypothetical protein
MQTNNLQNSNYKNDAESILLQVYYQFSCRMGEDLRPPQSRL